MPLKPTCVACTKPVPVITTLAPTAALVGEMLLIVGSTRNVAELVAVVDPAWTAIFPALPAAGTVAVMLVGPFTVKTAAAPLNATDVAEVKPDPVIVTLLPTMPLAGVNPLIARVGAPEAVKLPELVAVPSGVVTVRGPVPAPAGTVAVIRLAETTV